MRHSSRFRASAALLLLALLMPVAAGAGEAPPEPILKTTHPLAGRIWVPSTGRSLTPDQLVAEGLAGGVVILGETHDNPDHHALQAWMMRRLAAAGRRPVAAFEMMETDQQDKIDAYLATHPGEVDGLADAVEWSKRGWSDWSGYSPIARATLDAGGQIRGANLPRDVMRQIGRGKEDEVAARMLGLDVDLPPEEQQAFAAEIRVAHCDLLPEGAVLNMVRVQRSRDAAMADVIATQAARPDVGPVVLIAGSGHARRNRGVPTRLGRITPGLRVLSIAFVEVRPGSDDPAAYAGRYGGAEVLPFDVVWFTARAEREDQCASLARRMKKPG